MEVQELRSLLVGGRFTRVRFYKRSNGELRTMICRTGVRRGVKGVGMPYVPAEHGLVVVYDARKDHFRQIDASTVVEVKRGSIHYLADGHA